MTLKREIAMLEKSFDEILEEREAAIRQQWAAQSKAKKIADAGDSSDGLIEGKRAMRTLTDEQVVKRHIFLITDRGNGSIGRPFDILHITQLLA